MPKYRVEELEGALLDAAVAKAEGISSVKISRGKYCMAVLDRAKSARMDIYEPSIDWSQGGPIVERERIVLGHNGIGGWTAFIDGQIASSGSDVIVIGGRTEDGPTPLVAAMRAYVASKFGQDVELP